MEYQEYPVYISNVQVTPVMYISNIVVHLKYTMHTSKGKCSLMCVYYTVYISNIEQGLVYTDGYVFYLHITDAVVEANLPSASVALKKTLMQRLAVSVAMIQPLPTTARSRMTGWVLSALILAEKLCISRHVTSPGPLQTGAVLSVSRSPGIASPTAGPGQSGVDVTPSLENRQTAKSAGLAQR